MAIHEEFRAIAQRFADEAGHGAPPTAASA